MPPEHPESSLPSVRARMAAFAAILVAGASGALIGYGVVNVDDPHSTSTARGVGAIVGAVVAAVGVAVVSVLVLRAMGEWRTIQRDRERELRLAEIEAADSEDRPEPD